jgi:RNA polymerase sigma factor (sigma-70 family)
MDSAAPLELGILLHAPDLAVREAAWEKLIAGHTRLLLAVTRSFGGGHDEAMERYSYILGKLRENDFRRLRAFLADGRASFPTWLTVAARRLCLDYHRSRYGRTRAGRDSEVAAPLRALRRRLADSVSADLDTDLLPDAGARPADEGLVQAERDHRLRAAVETLPARDRLLLTLRFDDDLSAARISGILGFPTPFHVYRRLNAVLGQLRSALRSHGIEGADG